VNFDTLKKIVLKHGDYWTIIGKNGKKGNFMNNSAGIASATSVSGKKKDLSQTFFSF
jgi:hypothetical protein